MAMQSSSNGIFNIKGKGMSKIIMNKIIFFLASVIAAVTFASEASALPVFARQTGMECAACHFQHFPLLSAFGRAFKTGGFTMIGAQAQVEGGGLSLPATVNAAVLTSMGYEKTNATKAVLPANLNMSAGGASTGGFFVGSESGEASLFVGGRGSDFMGYLGEITLGNGGAAMDSLKTPILFDVNGTRVGPVFFSTNGQGASYGFETLNTGANAIHSITNTVGFQGQYINAVSAQQWLGTGAAATGASIVAANDMGFVNVTKFAQVGAADSGAVQGALGSTGTFVSLGSTYLRLAGTFDLAGWDSAVGVQDWTGSSAIITPGGPAIAAVEESKAWAIDGQTQGALGSMPAGFYFSYATAPASDLTTGIVNAFNSSTTNKRNSFNIDAELGVMPDKATVGAAVRLANNVDLTGAKQKDKALYLTATYKLAQNLLTRLSYVHESGSYWDQLSGFGGTNAQDIGKNSYTLNLYALF
jgi:hypothetical protein